jgi:hypothetical protein
MIQLALGPDRQALTRMLIDHRQHAERSTVRRPVHDEVVGPDMIPILGPEADTGTVIQPEPGPFGLFVEYFEPLPAPDPLHTLMVHMPTLVFEKGRDPPISIAAIFSGEIKDEPCQSLLVVPLKLGSI